MQNSANFITFVNTVIYQYILKTTNSSIHSQALAPAHTVMQRMMMIMFLM